MYPAARYFYLGGFPPSGLPQYYRGLIDEVGLYARVLSVEEILGIYRAGAGGRCGDEPRLTVATVGQSNLLSWPLGALGFALESATNLAGAWVQETNISVFNGDSFLFSPGKPATQEFLRLRREYPDVSP